MKNNCSQRSAWIRVIIMVTLIAGLALLGCRPRVKDDRPLIVTSIHPYKLLIQEIVGDSIQVRSLIPPKASPHTWTAKPADMKSLDDAKLLVINGLGLETELTGAFEERSPKLIDVSKLLKLEDQAQVQADSTLAVETDHAHAGMNPHIWLSPQLMLRAVIMLSDELQTRFPSQAATIRANTSRMINDLAAVHRQITSERAAIAVPILITYHDSFHWFAKDYDVQIMGTVQSSPGQEPTARELTLLGAVIKTNKIKAIFVEPQMDKRSAKVLADEFGLALLELDPLGQSLGSARLIDLIWSNWERMKLSWKQEKPSGKP